MERNTHAELKIHVSLKQRSLRGQIAFPLMPILTFFFFFFPAKGAFTMSFDVCVTVNCGLLKQVLLLVKWGWNHCKTVGAKKSEDGG